MDSKMKKMVAKELLFVAKALAAEEDAPKTEEKPKEEPKEEAKEASVKKTASVDLAEIRRELREMIAKAPDRVEISELPGMSKSQVKSWIASVVKARQELETIRMQYEAVLKQMKGLEDVEKKGIDTLKTAAAQMKEKGRYLVDTENGLLEFTAYIDTKRPGIKQMLFDPETTPAGEKAGELLERVSRKLGEEVAAEIANIYRECYEDLSHSSDALKLLKVVSKTASVDMARLKKAGVADVIISIKDWLAGGTDSIVKRMLNFAGDVNRWIKGFIERTKLVKKSADKVSGNLNKVKSLIDDYVAAQEA